MSVHHDYTKAKKGWGHDLIFKPVDGGMRASATGWGYGIKQGHFLILSHPNSEATARYRVDGIEYLGNPQDMWDAKLSFAPRQIAYTSDAKVE